MSKPHFFSPSENGRGLNTRSEGFETQIGASMREENKLSTAKTAKRAGHEGLKPPKHRT